MSSHRDDETRISALLAASRAEAGPGLLAAAWSRLDAAAEREPAWLAWLARPAALAASCGLLVASLGFAWWSVQGSSHASPMTESEWLTVLLGDDGSLGLGGSTPESRPGTDTGSVQ